jgi:hypothetical protein
MSDHGDQGDAETYHGYSVDDENQPQDTGDSQADDRGLAEPLDEGYSPPEKWSAAQRYGNTALEEELGESLDQRLEQEEQEPDPYTTAEREADDPDFGAYNEVGDKRAGRLVEDDDREGVGQDVFAEDVGIDGAGASAEEAAMHVIEESDET